MEYVNVSTTQNIDLEYKMASIGDRILAYGFDILVQGAWLIIWLIILLQFGELEIWHSIFALPVILYNLLCEIFLNGQSFGKMVLKIRVAKLDGSELTLGTCLIRWIMRIIDISIMSGVVAIVSILMSNKGQRLGDLAAGTTVLKVERKNFFEQTTYVDVPDDYECSYPQSSLLSDDDARIIKEVLIFVKRDNKKNGEIRDYHPILLKTQNAFKKKLNIKEVQGTSMAFLEDLLKDFNHYHK